jgi:hypothetical protein
MSVCVLLNALFSLLCVCFLWTTIAGSRRSSWLRGVDSSALTLYVSLKGRTHRLDLSLSPYMNTRCMYVYC